MNWEHAAFLLTLLVLGGVVGYVRHNYDPDYTDPGDEDEFP